MQTKRKIEWFDNDLFWRDLYPAMFPQERIDAASGEVDKILLLARPRGKAVLDLCCGPGRHSIALAKRKFKVTGVDRTKYFLRKARDNARKSKLKVEWIQKDMRDFVRPDSFDFALSMFTSFGYFDNQNQNMLVLKNIFDSLRRGGILLIDTIGKERLAKIYQPTTSDILPNGALLVQRHVAIDDWTRMWNEWIIINKGIAKSYHFQHTIYSGQELKNQLQTAGFSKIKLYGDFNGDAYGPYSQRLVAVAIKPK